jgi:hypothetical protein
MYIHQLRLPSSYLCVALICLVGCSGSTTPMTHVGSSEPAAQDPDGLNESESGASAGWRRVTPEHTTTPLIAALLDRDEARFRKLLSEGANPNEWDQFGRNAVIVASGIPNSRTWLQQILVKGGNPNARAPESIESKPLLGGGFAPLHMATSIAENQSNIRMLVEAGADVNEKDAYGMTPLGHAIDARFFDVAAYLISVGANPDDAGVGGVLIRDQIGWFGNTDDFWPILPEEKKNLDILRETLRKHDTDAKQRVP